MIRLIQIKKGNLRRVAVVEESNLRLVDGCSSIFELANIAIAAENSFSDLIRQRAKHEVLDYDRIYDGYSEWRILPALDHPEEPARCLVSGTGLTHLGSARNRQSMHETRVEDLTDSMKMFRWGLEGGRPAAECVGIAPEWFYKGTGFTLRGHGEAIEIPEYAEDGGEEAEIAGLYIIAANGCPYRVGMAIGNEFSDHEFERKNYLYLAGSKLRNCAIGPELVINPQFDSVAVTARIERSGETCWCKTFRSGEREMCHSLQNIEHHHFKFKAHRRPGDVHVHFFGTDCLSYSDGLRLQEGDVMEVTAEGFGRPLRNSVHVVSTKASVIRPIPLN